VKLPAHRAGLPDLMSTSSAYNREEFIEGMVTFAIAIKVNNGDIQTVIWAVDPMR